MALPYDLDSEGVIPAAAMRAAVRPPMAAPSPIDPPTPNWQNNNEWGNLTSLALKTLGKFGEDKEDRFSKIDEQLADLKKQRAEFAAMMGQFNKSGGEDLSGPGGNYNSGVRAIESGFDDNAENKGSGAAGRYQFLPATAKSLIPDLDLKTLKNVDVQERLMKLYTDQSVQALSPVLGRRPKGSELYLAHLLGHAGAMNVLKNPEAPITNTIDKKAYNSNKALLGPYATGRALVAGLDKRFGD